MSNGIIHKHNRSVAFNNKMMLSLLDCKQNQKDLADDSTEETPLTKSPIQTKYIIEIQKTINTIKANLKQEVQVKMQKNIDIRNKILEKIRVTDICPLKNFKKKRNISTGNIFKKSTGTCLIPKSKLIRKKSDILDLKVKKSKKLL